MKDLHSLFLFLLLAHGGPDIDVDDIRVLNGFFQLSAADGGRRVVIIDDADEMNPNAANALLKMLEEPGAGTVLYL